MPSAPGPSATARLLVGLSRLAPATPFAGDAAVDWETLARDAVGEGVAPLLHRNLRASGVEVPGAALELFRKAYRANEVRNARLFRRLVPLFLAAGARGLRVLVTKGARLALTVYPEIGLRPFADVDLVVHPKDWGGLEPTLAELGYVAASPGRARRPPRDRSLDWTFSPCYRLGDLVVELHFSYLGLHIPSLSEADLWATAVRVPVDGTWATVMSPEYELSYLCLHAQQHSYARLVWLTDIAELGSSEGMDWGRVGALARREGIVPVVRHGLRIVNALWPGTVPGLAFAELGGGSVQGALMRAFWPPARAILREERAPMPYYTPSFFALLSRRKPLLAFRTLVRILFPPMDWIAETYDVEPGTPKAWSRYVRRLCAPFVRPPGRRGER